MTMYLTSSASPPASLASMTSKLRNCQMTTHVPAVTLASQMPSTAAASCQGGRAGHHLHQILWLATIRCHLCMLSLSHEIAPERERERERREGRLQKGVRNQGGEREIGCIDIQLWMTDAVKFPRAMVAVHYFEFKPHAHLNAYCHTKYSVLASLSPPSWLYKLVGLYAILYNSRPRSKPRRLGRHTSSV